MEDHTTAASEKRAADRERTANRLEGVLAELYEAERVAVRTRARLRTLPTTANLDRDRRAQSEVKELRREARTDLQILAAQGASIAARRKGRAVIRHVKLCRADERTRLEIGALEN